MGYNYIKWNDTLIENEIYKVMRALNINRMPSKDEIMLICKSCGLSNAICKRGGHYAWASRLGLQIKNCETKTGKGFENVATKILQDKGYRVKQMSTKYPFDLLVNESIKIDVKAGRPYLLKGSRVHTVGINKKYATCDLYLIFVLDEQDTPEKTFLIPGCELVMTTLNFGENTKYDIYNNRWDYVEQYDKFYQQLHGNKCERVIA